MGYKAISNQKYFVTILSVHQSTCTKFQIIKRKPKIQHRWWSLRCYLTSMALDAVKIIMHCKTFNSRSSNSNNFPRFNPFAIWGLVRRVNMRDREKNKHDTAVCAKKRLLGENKKINQFKPDFNAEIRKILQVEDLYILFSSCAWNH